MDTSGETLNPTFSVRKLMLSYRLGEPAFNRDGGGYWSSRLKWVARHRIYAVRSWKYPRRTLRPGQTSSGGGGASKKIDVRFSADIDIFVIPPKEGEEFDLSTATVETFPDIELYKGELGKGCDYVEYWTDDPFSKVDGAKRPYFCNVTTGATYWCRCKTPKGFAKEGVVTCKKCLESDVLKIARKSTPEQFHKRYLINAGF